jgi:hypothetical protein
VNPLVVPDLSFGIVDRLQAILAGPLTALFLAAGIWTALRVLSESIERIGDEVEPAKDGQAARRITIAGVTLIAVVVVNNGLDVFRELVRFAYSLAETPAK